MTTYRRKPETIEAEQWFPGVEMVGVVMKPNYLGGRGHGRIKLPPQPYLEYPGFSSPLYPGDYITRSEHGRGVARKEYFEENYELAPPSPAPTCGVALVGGPCVEAKEHEGAHRAG